LRSNCGAHFINTQPKAVHVLRPFDQVGDRRDGRNLHSPCLPSEILISAARTTHSYRGHNDETRTRRTNLQGPCLRNACQSSDCSSRCGFRAKNILLLRAGVPGRLCGRSRKVPQCASPAWGSAEEGHAMSSSAVIGTGYVSEHGDRLQVIGASCPTRCHDVTLLRFSS